MVYEDAPIELDDPQPLDRIADALERIAASLEAGVDIDVLAGYRDHGASMRIEGTIQPKEKT